MSHQKHDPLAIEFLTVFSSVRELMDDDPKGMEHEAEKDAQFCALCFRLAEVARQLESAEKNGPVYAAPVDPAFIKQWRDYERRYSRVIRHIDLYLGLMDTVPELVPSGVPIWQEQQLHADKFARQYDRGFSAALNHIAQIANDDSSEIDEDFLYDMRQGLGEFESLVNSGLSIRDVFRRRQLVPFVLIPRQVARYYNPNGALSLFTHLQQAQDAFVYGASLAAIALARAILEMVLRRHYRASPSIDDQTPLNIMIDRTINLPAAASAARLHRFRKLANVVLHPVSTEVKVSEDIEMEVVSILLALRDLIEQAPQRPN